MTSRILIAALTTMIAVSMTAAAKTVCTQRDSLAAENGVDHIKTWNALHAAYQRYRQCDDGGIAEGYSDAVAQLMAKHWDKIGEAATLARNDPAFGTWILRHLDETDNDADLVMIERLARTQCPNDAAALCHQIRAQIKSLGCDPSYPQGSSCIAAKNGG